MRKLFYRIGNNPRLLEAAEAIRTRPKVRLKGGDAKTLLVIEEEVDLSRKKVTVIHERVYAASWKVVSVKKMHFGNRGISP